MNLTAELAPGLAGLLAEVSVAPDLRSATAFGRELSESEPRDLERALAMAFYEVLHLGRADGMELRSRMVRELELERRFVDGVPHTHRTVPTTVLRRSPDEDRVLVDRGGVRTWIPLERLAPGCREVSHGPAEIVVRPYRAGLSPGFFLVDGSVPTTAGQPMLRVYVHIEASTHAPAVWQAVLSRLEHAKLPYRAKVASVGWFYPRCDTLVVYLPEGAWQAARLVAAAASGQPGVAPEVSAFCHRLADGVSMAWDPVDTRPGMQGLSFGDHRSTVLASALTRAAATGADRYSTVVEELVAAAIDPVDPWRNLGSPEIAIE